MDKKFLLKKPNKKFLFLKIISLNFIFSTLVFAQAVSNGTITVSGCSTNCLTLQAPLEINSNQIKFIDPLSENLVFQSTSSKIIITDIENNGGFNLTVNIENLINIDTNTEFIPYDKIGILTYSNNTATNGLDGEPIDNTVSTPIYYNYLYSDFLNQFANYNPNLVKNQFTYFSGVGPVSDDILLINAPTISGRFAEYTTGIGVVIKVPNINSNFITDGKYQLNLTFTLNRS